MCFALFLFHNLAFVFKLVYFLETSTYWKGGVEGTKKPTKCQGENKGMKAHERPLKLTDFKSHLWKLVHQNFSYQVVFYSPNLPATPEDFLEDMLFFSV